MTTPQTRPRAPRSEQIDIRTSDGWSLRTDVHEPATGPVGVAVLAHALMARRQEFDRPRSEGVLQFLLDRGWSVVAFDFRGHGESGAARGKDARYGYDDFVSGDLPAVHAFARSRSRRHVPIVLVGHSLGGHVGLAAQGTGLVAFDGIVAVGACIWLRSLEPSGLRWLAKRALLAGAVALARSVGRFPARALRLGSDDESRACVDDFDRFARTGVWGSADGRFDYLSALARVRIPVLQMVSDGDRIECTPECGARFVAHCAAQPEIVRIARGDDGGAPPDHMGIVTSTRSRTAWVRAETWMRQIRT